MKKNSIREYIVLGIIFVLYTLVVFLVLFEKNAIFWIAYVFAVIALATQLYVLKVAFANEDTKSKFYGFPIARVGIIYLAVQLIASLVEMILGGILPPWMAVLVNAFIVGFAVVGFVATVTVREEIVKQDEKLKEDVANIRMIQSMASTLSGQCEENVKVDVEKLVEEIRYSDPVSGEETKQLEEEVIQMMKELQAAIVDNEEEAVKVLCKKITGALAERNRLCKLNK